MKNRKNYASELMLTYLSPEAERQSNAFTIQERMKVAAQTIKECANSWGDQRRDLELEWSECWAEYLSNHRAADFLRHSALQVTGKTMSNEGEGWRHKVTTGKAFELVETVNSYLQGAFFPNKQWFDLVPKAPMDDDEWEDTLYVLTHYLLQKYDEARFRAYWEVFCRQILICGTSVLALPWRYDAINTFRNRPKKGKDGKTSYVPTEELKVIQNGFDFEVVDMYDFYLDPSSGDQRKANCIRRIVKTRGEVVRLIESGVYPLGDKEMVSQAAGYSPNVRSSVSKDSVTYMAGLESVYFRNNNLIELYEYWGNLQIGDYEFVDVCATVLGDNLISIMPNPYWGGRPFVIGTLVDIHDSPYGIGLLQPVLGQLHALFETSNHRLDVDELTINPTLLAINDGSIDFNSLFVAPGKVIPVEDVESTIVPLELPNQSQVSVQDEQILEARVDKTTGVGSYVGVNGGRNAERVTAEEVNAQREAGGNRLGNYHKHLEDTALRDFLEKSYSYLQQFVINDEVVRIKRNVQESFREQYDYFQVGQEELNHEMDIIPVGSDHIVNKEYELKQRIDFYTFASQYPEIAKFINWKEAIKDLARRFMKQDWEKFVMLPEEQPAPVPGEEQLAVDAMTAGGGQPLPPGMEGMPPGMPPEAMGQPAAIPPVGGASPSDALGQRMAQDPQRMMEALQRSVEVNR